VTRKFALTKIGRGDWLLPSNDGQTLWRLTEYHEDGSASVGNDGKNWRPLRGVFWQTAKFTGRLVHDPGLLPDDFLDWGHWEVWETGLLKRKYAVEAVLNRG